MDTKILVLFYSPLKEYLNGYFDFYLQPSETRSKRPKLDLFKIL